MEEVSHSRRAVIAGAGALTLRAAVGDLTSAQCSEVEVFPGYPGFRGYVTGVDGFGDVACLAELEASDSGFDRDDVNRLNQAAASRLGIAGQPTDWTWENWMAIEAERGLAQTCYSCAIEDGAVRGEPSQSIIPPNDPRLLNPWAARSLTYARQGLPGSWRDQVRHSPDTTPPFADYFAAAVRTPGLLP